MCIFKYMKSRKNISLSKEAVEFLSRLSMETGKSQSEIIEQLIREKYEEENKKRKLKAFKKMVRLVQKAKPVAGKDISFKESKGEMGIEKYF